MEAVTEHFNQLRSQLPSNFEEVQSCISQLKEKIPTSYDDIEPYVNALKNVSTDDIVSDFSNLKVTPITVSLSITAFTTLFILGRILGSSGQQGRSKSSKKNQKKRSKKKLTKAQKANEDIQSILDFVEETYVPEIDEYLENYKTLKEDDLEYKYNYFEEMLLKQLMKLDGIDVVGNDILRDNRKKVIKFIQDHQRRLDAFKKEVNM
ncbi:DEHA2B14982p [Debaryomyces hansenii CBS767]|jgi:HSP70 co-chaperone SNL1|uniref:DEHA2B14982p n=1 Tax=Debaryomyces hansenii (strain ATCC 36239 / CBS 767 / BCRC 21394 / JCM 1990 / NBRC 0083 / IGC 2968) TaxID=284592 RepID=Q6BW20_DEBHA|nr:DEHA2B14982p [Debaryomyces hansenii CBS767]CAG85610.1 DEHA2B14982p [Debaryomyces hansenii CBS767]|eukprot:XP_457599.1 DEHA2B14982p [Debaryomyces hansenii CBS767]